MHRIRHRRCAIIIFYQCNLFLQPFPFFADLRAPADKKAKLNQEKSYSEMAFKMMNKCKVAFTVSLINFYILEKTQCVAVYFLSLTPVSLSVSSVFGRNLLEMLRSYERLIERDRGSTFLLISNLTSRVRSSTRKKFSLLFIILNFVFGIIEAFLAKWSIISKSNYLDLKIMD